MTIIPTFSSGDIVVVRFPYSNLAQTELRPALAVSPASYVELTGEVLLMQITSRASRERPQYKIRKWREAGLKKESYVRYANLHHIRVSHVAGKIGRVDEDEYQNVISLLGIFLRS
ncbi:type II toxin-antitoxin system PemK/MazF family toxin [Cohnella thermotolerans]|uniref:type II toxin-antitoxin system PemK/MazF family toxin n=1 Tax=Cohnella thermotolerans TaxID=329858 RepID=UPI000419CE94|nr:type II toxin-antitoxin system PemK/MazF family toxin [Cohnella thermotolerans]